MTIYVPQHDESVMPITLGSVLRCPAYSWTRWGVKWGSAQEYKELLDRSELEY